MSKYALRPLCALDAEAIVALYVRCSDATVAMRTLGAVHRPTLPDAWYVCLRNDGLVALDGDAVRGLLTWQPVDGIAANLALLIEDAWQTAGLGRKLLDAGLAAIAAQGCKFAYGATLPENTAARRLLAHYPVTWKGPDFVMRIAPEHGDGFSVDLAAETAPARAQKTIAVR